MRIPDNQSGGIGAPGINRTQETVTATSTGRTGTERKEGGDQIQISNLAAHLKAASPGSAERAARIELLRVQVAQGEYAPDADKVSSAMMEEALGSARENKTK